MYRRGDLQIKHSLGEDIGDPAHPLHDNRWPNKGDRQELPVGTIFLPHSCDEWVIGGEAEARQMLEDLTVLMARRQRLLDGDT